MLSGEFGSISTSAVQARPDGDVRQELDPDKIAELANSIARKGLMHPIVITREAVLVAGGRRLAACRSLGWTHISYQYVEDLPPEDLLEIELEENIKRVDLPWKDQCIAVQRLHELRKAKNPAWTMEETAKESGWSIRFVSERLMVADKLRTGDERVVKAKEFSVAKGITQRINDRAKTDQLATITAVPGMARPTTPIIQANFHEWAAAYNDYPFNFIHCDFPYGIGADKFQQAGGDAFGGYSDTFENYSSLIDTLDNNKDRLMGESCHVMFWFSMRHYQWTLERLRALGLWVDFQPLIWYKSDNAGALPDPERGPRRVYETAFWCSWGDRKILSGKANTFAAPVTRLADHMSEKSQPMLEHFLGMAVDGTTRLLDPTCGSGSSLRAARALGCTQIAGLEANEEYVANAQRAWNANG